MEVKKIYPREIYGTPQVNILNYNVLESVDYTYKDISFNYKQISDNYSKTLYEFPAPEKSATIEEQYVPLYSTSISQYKWNGDQTSNLTVIKDDIPKKYIDSSGDNIKAYDCFVSAEFVNSDIGQERYYKLDYDFGDDGRLSQFTENGSQVRYIIRRPYSSFVDMGQGIKFANSYDEVKQLFFNLDENGEIISSKYLQGYSTPAVCIVKNGDNYVLYVLFTKYVQDGINLSIIRPKISFSLSKYVINAKDVSIDTNSLLTLDSNELIQKDTGFKELTETSEYYDVFTKSEIFGDQQIENGARFTINLTDEINNGKWELKDFIKMTVNYTYSDGSQSIDGSYSITDIDRYVNSSSYYSPTNVMPFKIRYENSKWYLDFICSTGWLYGGVETFGIWVDYSYNVYEILDWKDVVPQEIVKQYKNGKATMSLQALYDGTNEYAVGDLVIPMKTDTEPVLINSYEPEITTHFDKDDFIYKENLYIPNYLDLKKQIPNMKYLISVSVDWGGTTYDGLPFSGSKTFDVGKYVTFNDDLPSAYVHQDENINFQLMFFTYRPDIGVECRYEKKPNAETIQSVNVTVNCTTQVNEPKQFEVTSNEIVYTGKSVQNLELVEYVEVTE